jgi:hypothetical protein
MILINLLMFLSRRRSNRLGPKWSCWFKPLLACVRNCHQCQMLWQMVRQILRDSKKVSKLGQQR